MEQGCWQIFWSIAVDMDCSLREELFEAKNRQLFGELLRAYGSREGFAILNDGWSEHFGLLPGSFVFLEPVWRSEGEFKNDLQRACGSGVKQVPHSCGFFSYELLHDFEQVPRVAQDLLRIPKYSLWCYAKLLFIPQEVGAPLRLFHFTYEDAGQPFWQAEGLQSILKDQRSEQAQTAASVDFNFTPADLSKALAGYSNFTSESYAAAVSFIRELIAAGEVYQVNLSQQFTLPFSFSGRQFIEELQRISPARYSAYLNFSTSQIVSASPELFVASRNGNLLSSPIKGTRARFRDVKLDRQAELELRSSEKDRAELAMIVDLTRNDLGRIAKIGSVQVQNHARLEKLAQVQHLVSDVGAELAPGLGLVEVLAALFPCGSITGCPKIAAMNYISQLEGRTRGIYTGAICCLSGAKDFVLNVAIRTALLKNAQCVFQAGGGVVYDSDPAKEYEETLIKAAGMYRAYLMLEQRG